MSFAGLSNGGMTAALLLLSLVLAPSPASPQEWSRFRGPNGAGVSASTGLPETFGPEQNLRWRTALAAAHSSPVLGTDAVFLTAADETGLIVVSLARDTGAVRWERRLERTSKQEVYPA